MSHFGPDHGLLWSKSACWTETESGMKGAWAPGPALPGQAGLPFTASRRLRQMLCEVRYFNGRRNVRRILHVDAERTPPPFARTHGCGAHRQQQWTGRPRGRATVGDLGETTNLLQQLHQFYFRCHALNAACECNSRAMGRRWQRQGRRGGAKCALRCAHRIGWFAQAAPRRDKRPPVAILGLCAERTHLNTQTRQAP